MNFYLIYGLDYALIKKKQNEIIKELNITKNNIIKYSSNETRLDSILEDASMISLFQDKKIIIIEDANYFSSGQNDIPVDTEQLLSYLNNYNKDTYIIFIVINDKIDSRLKITKKIMEIGKVLEIKNYEKNNSLNYIKDYLKDYNINNIDLTYLQNQLYNDINNINNELDKLILYKENDKNITREDINNIISPNSENDIFDLIESITKKNISRSIDLYHDLLLKNEEPIKILAVLESKYRLIYQVLKLSNENKTLNEMQKILNIHVYPIKLALELSYQYTTQELSKYIKDLSEIDSNIKIGNITNIPIALELFILKIQN